MRGRTAIAASSAKSVTSSWPCRSALGRSAATTSSAIGAMRTTPRPTTARPVSSSLRKRTSSTSSAIASTSCLAWSSNAAVSAPGSEALSSRASRRASGVRSSCETAAVNPIRSSSNGSARSGSAMIRSMAKVLIVEDDEIVARSMSDHLAAAGHEPKWMTKGEQGLAAMRYEAPDVVILDLMLPQRYGWSVIEHARADGIGTPIIVVSARGTEHDRVHALDIGADDYMVKPFSMNELVARVQAAARRGVRSPEPARGEQIEIEELRIDPREVQAYVDGESCDLTPTEFRLLYQLALDRGRVVTRDELLQKLWGRRETRRDRTVDVFVRRLRDKVDRAAPRHTFIQTRYGFGYKLEPVAK